MAHEEESRRFLDGSHEVIAACIEVHRQLGPGLLESIYEQCLCYELTQRGMTFERQVLVPLVYRGMPLDCGYRMDLVVDSQIVVEVKAVEHLLPVHEAQVLSYLKLTKLPTGLIVNFHVAAMRSGLRRLTLKDQLSRDTRRR